MGRLMKAFLFKLSRDVTFRVTLIIGTAMAFGITLIYFGLQSLLVQELDFQNVKLLTGHSMLISSMSPVDNFGIVLPINLIIFTCLEFTQGTIRNKIIAGNSKILIYTSLYLTGLVFTLSLLSVYILLCTGLGTIFGGFNLKEAGLSIFGGASYTPEYLIKMGIICILTYSCIVSVTVFFAALFRNVGPCIPIILVLLFACYFAVTIVQAVASVLELAGGNAGEILLNVARIINPMHAIAAGETVGVNPHMVDGEVVYESIVTKMNDVTFYGGIANNLIYGGAFFGFGALIFSKRDVK